MLNAEGAEVQEQRRREKQEKIISTCFSLRSLFIFLCALCVNSFDLFHYLDVS